MSKLLLYLVGPATGLLIFIIGVIVALITGYDVEPIGILKIALGVALMTEFAIVLSLMERGGERE